MIIIPLLKSKMTGILKSYENQKFVFEVEGKDIEIELAAIAKLNLHIDF